MKLTLNMDRFGTVAGLIQTKNRTSYAPISILCTIVTMKSFSLEEVQGIRLASFDFSELFNPAYVDVASAFLASHLHYRDNEHSNRDLFDSRNKIINPQPSLLASKLIADGDNLDDTFVAFLILTLKLDGSLISNRTLKLYGFDRVVEVYGKKIIKDKFGAQVTFVDETQDTERKAILTYLQTGEGEAPKWRGFLNRFIDLDTLNRPGAKGRLLDLAKPEISGVQFNIRRVESALKIEVLKDEKIFQWLKDLSKSNKVNTADDKDIIALSWKQLKDPKVVTSKLMEAVADNDIKVIVVYSTILADLLEPAAIDLPVKITGDQLEVAVEKAYKDKTPLCLPQFNWNRLDNITSIPTFSKPVIFLHTSPNKTKVHSAKLERMTPNGIEIRINSPFCDGDGIW